MIISIIILCNGRVNFFTAEKSWEGRELLNVNTKCSLSMDLCCCMSKS